MITIEQYFGDFNDSPDATNARWDNATRLLSACALLEELAVADGVVFPDNPITGSGVSGQHFGGFRPQDCPIGSPHSAHKEGLAVDRYDPHDDIDEWCRKNKEPGGKLEQCGIYIEAVISTPKWSHWQIRRPGSGNREFQP